jgi:hypothetical protein
MQESRIRSGRPEAAAAIWDWHRAGSPESLREPSARLRIRGALQALAGGMAGVLIFVLWSRTVAAVALGVAGLILLASYFSPTGLYATLRRLFDATGIALGKITTPIAMAMLFYLFFLPFGRLLRRGRRNQLKPQFEAEAATYWEPHPAATAESRERQY